MTNRIFRTSKIYYTLVREDYEHQIETLKNYVLDGHITSEAGVEIAERLGFDRKDVHEVEVALESNLSQSWDELGTHVLAADLA